MIEFRIQAGVSPGVAIVMGFGSKAYYEETGGRVAVKIAAVPLPKDKEVGFAIEDDQWIILEQAS